MQCPAKNVQVASVDVDLQQPVTVIVQPMSAIFLIASANVASWILVLHQKRVMPDLALVINVLLFVLTPL